MRHISDPVILTTIPHVFPALITLICGNKYYSIIIFFSTTLSILWHTLKEPKNWIMKLDYLISGIWFIFDIYFSIITNKKIIIILNVFSLLMNYICDWLAYKKVINYDASHSIWHIVNVIKSTLIVLIIFLRM